MLSRQNGTGVEASVPFYFYPMLVFLAESKTMSSEQLPLASSEYENHMPLLEKMADAIMSNISHLSPPEISEKMGISGQLGVKTLNLAYDFANKTIGYLALEGFTGEAYKGLEAFTMTKEGKDNAAKDLRIISSAYGYLRPSDIIKPYRLEYNKEICPDDMTPIKYFKPKVTVEIVKEIKEANIKDIIDLLPADADAMLDWKIIRAFAKVHKICFKVMKSDGSLKTPIAKRLKELRGKMSRFIFENGIDSFNQLISTESPDFIYSPLDSKPGLPVFISTE